jgi:hypothetical protein
MTFAVVPSEARMHTLIFGVSSVLGLPKLNPGGTPVALRYPVRTLSLKGNERATRPYGIEALRSALSGMAWIADI